MEALLTVILLVAGVAAAPSRPRYGHSPAPSYRPAPSYSPAPSYRPTPSYRPAPSYDAPAQYDFNYAVKDDYSGNDFGQQETRNGYDTQGSYHVLLPDGRLQTVTYTVNGDSGYVAEVSYQGEAQYPAYSPAPSYKPVPRYTPSPVYG